MTYVNNMDAKAVVYVWGTPLPEHWLTFLEDLARKECGAPSVYTLVRRRLLMHGISDTDVESAAERKQIATSSYKQLVIKQLFSKDGLPLWNIPKPKARRALTKGRKALRKPETVPNPTTSNSSGVFIRLKPETIHDLNELAEREGLTLDMYVRRLFALGVKTKGIMPRGVKTSFNVLPQPDQQEG